MKNKNEGISRYHLGERLLIGYRNDHSLFWLRTDKDYWKPKKDELNVLEAGKTWIDKKSDTTVLDFPITDEAEMHRLQNEFIQGNGNDWIFDYKETDYYVNLAECLRSGPEKPEEPPCEWIDPDYELPDHIDGYILDGNTFLRKNNETGELYYIKFTEFSDKDIENDRFGWIKAAKEFFSISSDEELLYELKGFRKESYGNAWIDEVRNVVVLGPVHEQRPEFLDNYYHNRIISYSALYVGWNKTKYWTDIESGLKRNPFDYKVNFFYMLDKYMG